MPPKQDRWSELCESVADDDGLPVRKAGAWTEQKVHFWSRYLEITTTAMWGKPQWPGGLVYLDLFAGPGVCCLDNSRKRFPGSVIVAANQRRPFSKIIACELNKQNAVALKKRLSRSPAAGHAHVIEGDCNKQIRELCDHIPSGSLTLAFVDPEALHARFETISYLTSKRSVDLLILFADSMDIVRNVDTYYAKQDHSKLDAMLGPASDWLNKWRGLANQRAENTCNLFADIYRDQLKKHLGYRYFEEKVMKSGGVPIYRIIFATRHELGLDFWRKAVARDAQGQKSFDF